MRIAFVGPAGAGKTTMAQMAFREFRGTILSFATPLKSELAAQFKIPLADLYSTKKHEYRTLMQTWGDAKRAEDPNYWVDKMFATLLATTGNIFVDDVRYINEHNMLVKQGFEVVRVDGGPPVLSATEATHESEQQWPNMVYDLRLRWADTPEQRWTTLNRWISDSLGR